MPLIAWNPFIYVYYRTRVAHFARSLVYDLGIYAEQFWKIYTMRLSFVRCGSSLYHGFDYDFTFFVRAVRLIDIYDSVPRKSEQHLPCPPPSNTIYNTPRAK